jgi:hypothetical protein
MSKSSRRKILTTGDWHNLIAELSQKPDEGFNPYLMRQALYVDIEQLRQRPLIVYATKFPDAHVEAPISIDMGDVDGFTDLVEAAPQNEKVDVLIHSPGGAPEATERIVELLRSKFQHITFLIPHSAYSAATMLALSGDEVLLHPSATLGPIDPQLGNIPARSIRKGFDKVRELLKTEGPEALPAYLPLIEKYSLELLEICDDALLLSKELATNWLKNYMFRGETDKDEVIEKAVDFFSNYDTHKTHSRPLTFGKIRELNLKIQLAEPDLRQLMREAHILLNGFFSASPFVKLYENSQGLSWGRQFQQLAVNIPVQQIPAQQR